VDNIYRATEVNGYVVDAAGLRQILRATPNVIYVWGHWHTDLNWYTQGPDTRLLSNEEGYWQVQCAATTYVWQYAHRPDGGTSQTFQADMRQGLVIDVYDSGVVVRGRDFSRHEWVPGFQATIPVNAPAHQYRPRTRQHKVPPFDSRWRHLYADPYPRVPPDRRYPIRAAACWRWSARLCWSPVLPRHVARPAARHRRPRRA
jgi:hypothetical protein